MRILQPSFEFEDPRQVDEEACLAFLEGCGRTCYKSEHRVGIGSARELVRSLIACGHESVIEHWVVTVRIICDRGVTHEVVRHRLGSYSQESTRFVNYAGGLFGSEIGVIAPFFFGPKGARRMIYVPGAPAWFEGELAFDPGEERHLNEFDVWFIALLYAEWAYMTLIDQFGRSPQEARSVLPNSLRTEIVVTFNLRQWRYFLRLRSSPACHPQMREVVVPLLAAFRKEMPAIFEDIPLPEDASQFLEG